MKIKVTKNEIHRHMRVYNIEDIPGKKNPHSGDLPKKR